MQAIEQKLESLYRRIQQQRMRDIPMCNPALRVEAVDFRKWGDSYLGIIITPWFMNLMLIPNQPYVFGHMKEGSKQTHVFPSGSYEFICGKEAELGCYQVCSLFSPMHEFSDQQTAVDTAKMVLTEIMEVRNRDSITMKATEQSVATQSVTMKPFTTQQHKDKNWERPISRRDFLRGGRSRASEQHPDPVAQSHGDRSED